MEVIGRIKVHIVTTHFEDYYIYTYGSIGFVKKVKNLRYLTLKLPNIGPKKRRNFQTPIYIEKTTSRVLRFFFKKKIGILSKCKHSNFIFCNLFT